MKIFLTKHEKALLRLGEWVFFVHKVKKRNPDKADVIQTTHSMIIDEVLESCEQSQGGKG